MIAALPMYDRAELRGATDRLWALVAGLLRTKGIEAPDALTRSPDHWQIWRAPDLLLAQTCGLPYRARLHDAVTLVGTPDYTVRGCAPGYYRSVIVAREGAVRPGDAVTLAFNDPLSQSGWAAALDWIAAEGLQIGALVQTGAHAASARAVAEGHADLAALDAVTWRLMEQAAAAPDGLEEIGRTQPTPGLPLITSRGQNPEPLARAFAEGVRQLSGGDRAALGLAGLAQIPAERYLALPIPPKPEAIARVHRI